MAAGAIHKLDADQISHIIDYLPVRDALRLFSVNHAHWLIMSNPRVWKPIYESLRRCGWKVSPALSGWKESFRRHMQAQAHWRQGIASASIHRLPRKMARGIRSSSVVAAKPIQALQLRLVHPKSIGTAQLLVSGRGGSLNLSKLVEQQAARGGGLDEGKNSLMSLREHQWEDVCTIKDAHKGMIHAIRMNDEGVITAGADRSVKVYDWNKNESYTFGDQHSSPIWGLDVDIPCNLIACSGFRWAQLWDTRTWHPPLRLDTAHESWIRTLQLLPAKHLLVTGSKDGKATVWDLRRGGMKSGEGLITLGHEKGEEVRDLQVSADGVLVTGCHDGLVRAWDLNTGTMEELAAGDQPVECIQACEKRVVSVDWRGEISCVINRTPMEILDAVLYGADKQHLPSRHYYRNMYKLRIAGGGGGAAGSNSRKSGLQRTSELMEGGGSTGKATGADPCIIPKTEMVEIERCNFQAAPCGPALEAPRVLSMHYDDQRIMLGGHDGSLTQLSFDTLVARGSAVGDEGGRAATADDERTGEDGGGS